MCKNTNFPLKNKINKDFNLKNTILFFGFQKKYIIFATEIINNKQK